MKLYQKNILLILIVLIIGASPFILKGNGEFKGADGIAVETVNEISPSYKPWIETVFGPKSREVESLLFALQASMGTGVVGFILGRITTKKPPIEEGK